MSIIDSAITHEIATAKQQALDNLVQEIITSIRKHNYQLDDILEAIAQRMELRPQREKRLKMIHRLGDEPDFDFLCECWEDLPLKLT
ncbi:MAG: hypothetical protein F6K28_56745, partial [Microcoleus sp. SIO2G3]|nr:hypothetical protein [Microcoleus sp. SIO2G3]